MPSGPWKPTYLSERKIRFLHAQSEKGKHIGFQNLANIVYTGEIKAGKPHKIAVRIAKRTAGGEAVKKGIQKGSTRQHIAVVR